MAHETAACVADAVADCEAHGGEVVGVMGISQGARLVAGLLLEREQGQGGARGGGGWLDGVRFGVLLNGTFPAMLPVSVPVPVPVPELGQGEGGVGVVAVPTLHVHGLLDPSLAQSRALLGGYFEKGQAVLLEKGVGHHLLNPQADVEGFVSVLVKMDEATRGTTAVAAEVKELRVLESRWLVGDEWVAVGGERVGCVLLVCRWRGCHGFGRNSLPILCSRLVMSG